MDITKLLNDLKKGKRGAVAKAITIIENNPTDARKLAKKIFAKTTDSTIIGITGPAGAGKSSLINKTVVALNRMGTTPAVLAIDPTSHITGGAILGDRVRMTESADTGTYIRSIASRGATGAVSASLRNSIRILEYAGFDPIIIESVGAGQTEVDISKIVDITTVVFNPHTGDSIQAIKAGLTEIGDIYVVNKADLTGADKLYDAIRDFVAEQIDIQNDANKKSTHAKNNSTTQSHNNTTSKIVLKTSIKQNTTITKFAKTLMKIAKDVKSKEQYTESKRRLRLKSEVYDMVISNARIKLDDMFGSDKSVQKYIDRLVLCKSNPFNVSDYITKSLLK